MDIDNTKNRKGDNYSKAVLLGVIFMLLFSPFYSVSNMIGLLFEQSGNKELGLISLFVLYFAFGVNCIFAGNLCAKYNPKYVMSISSIGYTLYMACGILVYICYDEGWTTGACSQFSIYSVVNVSAFLNGICSSTLWVSQPWYIQNISTNETRGRYFGVFWALMQSSQIFGNILGLILLEKSTLFYFIVMTAISFVSGLLFLFLPTPPMQKPALKSLGERLQGMLDLFLSPKMRPLLMYYFFSGTIVAVYTGFLYKQVKRSQPDAETDEEKKHVATLAAYVFIVLGLFEFLGGIISGHISDKYNRFLIAQNSTLLVEVALVTSIISYYLENYYICFVSGALWGASDCIVKNMTTILTTDMFPGRIEAFGIRALMSSMGVSVILIVNVNMTHPVWFLMVLAVVEVFNDYCTTRIGLKHSTALLS